MKDFFLDKFEYDFYATKYWIKCIENQEDNVTDFVKRSISHILNAHHIWIARLTTNEIESEIWDILPISYLTRLHEQTYRQIVDFLEKFELEEKINFHSSEGVKMTKNVIDVLYHMLNHSNYHRAQIVMELKQHGLEHPSLNFISYR
ncbi:MAG: DinB family protein [Flavobacteriia bacterium]